MTNITRLLPNKPFKASLQGLRLHDNGPIPLVISQQLYIYHYVKSYRRTLLQRES